MAENNIGKITQVIGAVIDIKFTDGNLPEINSAINIKTNDGGKLCGHAILPPCFLSSPVL